MQLLFTLVLVSQLGSPTYRVRERASGMLEASYHHPEVRAVLRGPFTDPEVADRVARFRWRYEHSVWPDIGIPWIDMLPHTGYPLANEIMGWYLARANANSHGSGVHGTGPLWYGDQAATWLWVKDMLAAGASVEDMRAILALMATAQRQSNYWDAYARATGVK